jgi:hypothetical protein
MPQAELVSAALDLRSVCGQSAAQEVASVLAARLCVEIPFLSSMISW